MNKSKKLTDKKIALQIASKFLNTNEISIKPVGEGSNNKNYLAKSKGKEIVIKLSFDHKEYKALQDYIKERWCIKKSSEKGIPGPVVLGLGRSQERAYMIETFVPGINGRKLKNKLHAYYELGKYTKRIHSIKVSGFGENLTNTKRGVFTGSWRKYLDYNIKSLTNKDKLIKLKVLNRDQSTKVKKIFENMSSSFYEKKSHWINLTSILTTYY